jgi:hypothetical protein
MIELYDAAGEKVAEIRDRRLVSMEGDCLAVLDERPDEVAGGRLHADMAAEDAWLVDGWLLDERGAALACADPERARARPWHPGSLSDWAYGREPA